VLFAGFTVELSFPPLDDIKIAMNLEQGCHKPISLQKITITLACILSEWVFVTKLYNLFFAIVN
jgi:hypothetical protein